MSYLVGALAMAFLCGGWVLVQRWITQTDPELKGPESGCSGCGGCGSCEREVDETPQLPRAQVLTPSAHPNPNSASGLSR